ncbi:hypothetical protein D3C76_1303280 [compost metagenome]
MVFQFEVIRQFGDKMLDLTRHRRTKGRRGPGAFTQQQAEGVGIIADKLHKGRYRRADHAAAFGNTLACLAHQLAQHQAAFVNHGEPKLIHIAKMTIERRGRDARLS